MPTKSKLKKIINEKLDKFYKNPDPNIHINSKSGRFLVYYYNRACPKGGEWHTKKGIPGKDDIKGSMNSARNYTSFILDYGQLMADLANKKEGKVKYNPKDFTYDTVLAIDTETGDIFTANNPATEEDPEAGLMTACGGPRKAPKPSQIKGTRVER